MAILIPQPPSICQGGLSRNIFTFSSSHVNCKQVAKLCIIIHLHILQPLFSSAVCSDISKWSLGSERHHFFLFFQSSPRNTRRAAKRPMERIIFMIRSCLRIRGWLCRNFRSGMGIGGFITSFFNLPNIPVSLSHMIEFWKPGCEENLF